MCIDDLHDKSFVADLIINHAPGVRAASYDSQNNNVKFLLGPKYALLRPEFFIKEHSSINKASESTQVLICFGGSDFKNLTQFILEKCNFNEPVEYTVITGSAYPYLLQLKEYLHQQSKNVKLLSSLNEREMKVEFCKSDICIVPASGILFEVLSCGVPVITGYYTQNQFDIYKGFLDLNVVYGAGNFSKDSFLSALNLMSTSRTQTMVENQKFCIDGNASQRILKAFKQL